MSNNPLQRPHQDQARRARFPTSRWDDGAGIWLWRTYRRNVRLASRSRSAGAAWQRLARWEWPIWIRWCFVDPKLAEVFAAEFAAFTLKKW